MKRAGATALIVTKMQTGQPTGIITEADISRAVVGREEPERRPRFMSCMTPNPTVVSTTASIRGSSKASAPPRCRITDVCRA